ncbi:hypothetical protein D3C73_1457640 [compost metagenome]
MAVPLRHILMLMSSPRYELALLKTPRKMDMTASTYHYIILGGCQTQVICSIPGTRMPLPNTMG